MAGLMAASSYSWAPMGPVGLHSSRKFAVDGMQTR
jgi:hypothetical protein